MRTSLALCLLAAPALADDFDPICYAAADRLAPLVVDARLARPEMGEYTPPEMGQATLALSRAFAQQDGACELILGLHPDALKSFARAVVEDAMQDRASKAP